jgi:uncharacterized DUF497 family protein
MMFEWDEAKSAVNAETRTRALGRVGNVVLACVYADRAETRRIFSLRHASRKERDAYREAFPE